MNDPNMPSVTPGPIIGLLAAALSVAAAFGLHVNTDQSVALISLGGALGVAIPAIEAWLRRGRLDLLAAREQAKAPAPVTTNITHIAAKDTPS